MRLGVFEQIRAGAWGGDEFRAALSAGELPEYHGGELGSIFDQVGGECPFHQESLVEHISSVIDISIGLADRNELGDDERTTLVTAATWHDVGKMVDRMWKTRHVCVTCGRPHGQPGDCRTDGCGGPLESRLVVGYHGHAQSGASLWMWGNISDRLGVPEPMRGHVRELILRHSDVHSAIVKGRPEGDPLAVLLSWADEQAKVYPPYGDPVRKLSNFPGAYRNARRRQRLIPQK